MLTYQMVKQLFPLTRGIVDNALEFRTVFTNPYCKAEKGLFVPLAGTEWELKVAIEQGAIASLWKNGGTLPSYIPNQFPIFFVPSELKALASILEMYLPLKKADNKETQFLLTIDAPQHHIEQNHSYDIAVINELQQLKQKWFGAQEKEGCEPSC
ncbi:hypothetical protein PNH38_03875 [Anoxybacillus rupiensis]|jgi:hypothetical protein|uniref:Uncharacterized protein n=1 Tax=Anoxybacteroides rupiense TaxID=311460 RepID=A0ABD5IR01_9BACL|nr:MULTISPECIES: hypothetical protein [Anoxybacillus]KXG10455.1 hypothetical protein AT864_01046 [Anoxybacillus sp. P3H1B]MBB3906261.1 hypothetical protein [Anoxybacillus rupiensis]MBS2770755.1 hypothetical protein [Anoxybacillus rupiensis]MDE8563021.1 hypothetical protein [Anoxybacillus rupiensis]MED5050396.1 hypothetical protein [Anoxybacillus rupiensis]